jgi:hypothetical protein
MKREDEPQMNRMDADRIDSARLRAGCQGHVKECGRLAHAAEMKREDKPQMNRMDADKIDSARLRAGRPGHVARAFCPQPLTAKLLGRIRQQQDQSERSEISNLISSEFPRSSGAYMPCAMAGSAL